jgi:hypothetical protein
VPHRPVLVCSLTMPMSVPTQHPRQRLASLAAKLSPCCEIWHHRTRNTVCPESGSVRSDLLIKKLEKLAKQRQAAVTGTVLRVASDGADACCLVRKKLY